VSICFSCGEEGSQALRLDLEDELIDLLDAPHPEPGTKSTL
jgi:hypothetical protein